MSGRFVVFEGIDGSGKSTLLDALLDLRTSYPTREPYADPVMGFKLDDPAYAALSFAADRRAHLDHVEYMLGMLDVLCDRYSLSMQAYQSVAGCDLDWLRLLDKGCRIPDLTVYLDIPADIAAEREAQRDGRVAGPEDVARLERLRAAYERALDGYPGRVLRLGVGTIDKHVAAVVAAMEGL